MKRMGAIEAYATVVLFIVLSLWDEFWARHGWHGSHLQQQMDRRRPAPAARGLIARRCVT